MERTECKEVIVTNALRRGDGISTPIRMITQVFEKDGTLIAENDPCPNVELVEAQQFYELMQSYRCIPIEEVNRVAEVYRYIKKYLTYKP